MSAELPASNGAPRVRVHHAVVDYDGKVALDDVSLDAAPGAMTAVVGGDGAGKTTLLRLLVGRVPLASGTIDVPDLARIGYLPATVGCWAGLTVAQNIEFVGGAYGVLKDRLAQRSDELLVAAGLAAFRDRPASQLSGGMRRKLGVAMAMVHDPALLVLDEPTTGVDPVSRVELWRLVVHAAAAGTTVVMSSTYMDEAERASQVLVLDQGRALLAGTPAQVVAGMRGVITEGADPQRDEWTWRRGRVYRKYWPEGLGGPAGAPGLPPAGQRIVEPELEDVVIVGELTAAHGPGGGP